MRRAFFIAARSHPQSIRDQRDAFPRLHHRIELDLLKDWKEDICNLVSIELIFVLDPRGESVQYFFL